MSAEAKVSDILEPKFTDVIENTKAQLKPLGSSGKQAERTLRVITDVLTNANVRATPAAAATENLIQKVAPVLQGSGKGLAPAAKLTEQHEYRNAESIEDNHG